MKNQRRVRAALLAGILAVAVAAPASAESKGAEAGLGAGAALSTLVYGPVKIVYAVLGSVFGGFAWALSGGDKDVARAVVMPAVLGDYVVTPSNLRGEEPLEFMGRESGYEPPEASVAAGAPSDADTYGQSSTYNQGW